jgi:hypothetical protein
MNYKSLLKYIQLKNFKKILISGSQRSGTTFLSYALSKDLKYILFDELKSLESFYNTPINSVGQAPSMSTLLHKIKGVDIFVIFLSRNCLDCIKSGSKFKLIKDNKIWNESAYGNIAEQNIIHQNCHDYYDQHIHSCFLKQNYWLGHQIHNMNVDFQTIAYDSIKDCPHYISERNFQPKQVIN